ncbi:MAG TPA: tetratricopeptide repeat protein [Aridibacter sp.]|nr:tetratricopeptide repeat protein [Aridibacter sp.]
MRTRLCITSSVWRLAGRHASRRAAASLIALATIALATWQISGDRVSAFDRAEDPLEKALYMRQEFFGSSALVPVPPAEAHKNLVRLLEIDPSQASVLARMAEIEERTGDHSSAERTWRRAAELNKEHYEGYRTFLNRRGRFDDAAKLLEERLLAEDHEGARSFLLDELLNSAMRHGLRRYLEPAFVNRHSELLRSNFTLFDRFVSALVEDGRNERALEIVRTGKSLFPDNNSELLSREVSLLESLGQIKEAEAAFAAAFDPFWNREEEEAFYGFLSTNDRLRAYGAELKARFRTDPSDFRTGVRLVHYRLYRSEPAGPVIAELERNKKKWTGDELLTAARLVIADGDGELASRFLYTLLTRGDVANDPELRARVLYQLFEVFCDSEKRRLTLSGGGLDAYAEMAGFDPDPGISSGVLSLLFSDSDPGGALEDKIQAADEAFNRSAAYRLFTIYKKEFDVTPEMAQMYLDLIRLYTADGGEALAYKLLKEFEQRHENSPEYPSVAMRLAAAFESRGEKDKAESIYRAVLDHTGKLEVPFDSSTRLPEAGFPGIRIPKRDSKHPDGYSYGESYGYGLRDTFAGGTKSVSYLFALERLVELHSKAGETLEILELYSSEIRKHPDREWLYEQRLEWLEETNLPDEEAEVYRSAVKRFNTHSWRDKLARFLLREGRKTELSSFAEDLSRSLGDAELETFLTDIASGGSGTEELRRNLLERLYLSALERFPSNTAFASGLLEIYESTRQERKWLETAGRFFFVSKSIRASFLDRLASQGELRNYLARAGNDSDVYRLFRAEALVRLSDFEAAFPAFRELAHKHPGVSELRSRARDLARSLGQKNGELLKDAAGIAEAIAGSDLSSREDMVTAGEIAAELGDFERASRNWEPVIRAAEGLTDSYLEAATVYWDYFQFPKARETIDRARVRNDPQNLFAFQKAAIYESEGRREEAIAEYVSALDSADDEVSGRSSAVKRLAALARRDPGTAGEIEAAYSSRKRVSIKPGKLSLAFADVLARSGEKRRSAKMLKREMRASRDLQFLKEALEFFESEVNAEGEQETYRRLIEVEESPRALMEHHLRLAESLRETRNLQEAGSVIKRLVRRFPENYGVISEASRLLIYLGFENEAVEVLKGGLLKAKGKYRLILARSLAKSQIEIGRLDEAAELLDRLHSEHGNDPVIFRALATVYVRQNRPEALRRAFDKTVKALVEGERERIFVRQELYELRKEMIEAFTLLNDPASAVDQYIEIINRNPNETGPITDMAIGYAKRYGVTERLIAYYRKLSKESFKNYRWNLVLSRLHEEGGALGPAIGELRKAIANSPDLPELHFHLSELELREGRTSEALEAVDRAIELSGESPELLKKKAEILFKAGRSSEAEKVRDKLRDPEGSENLFDHASRTDDARAAAELFGKAFEELLRDPVRKEVRQVDLTFYARNVRDSRSLSEANGQLWKLRDRLVGIADAAGSTDAGTARSRIRTVDAVIVSVIGGIARERAESDELRQLYLFLGSKLEDVASGVDKYGTMALVRDLAERAGSGVIKEGS